MNCQPQKLVDFSKEIYEKTGLPVEWRIGDGERILMEFVRDGNVLMSVRHVIRKDTKTGEVINDWVLMAEEGGADAVVIRGNKIGLMKVSRLQAVDQELYKATFPDFDVENLGRTSLEGPRGFGATKLLSDELIVEEVQSETGKTVSSKRKIGASCDNTSWRSGRSDIYVVTLADEASGTCSEATERIISGIEFFTLEEVFTKVRSGELYCGKTMAAIFMAMAWGYIKP